MAFKLALLIYSIYLTLMLLSPTSANVEVEENDRLRQLELEFKKLNLRVGDVELKNKDQDDDIHFLKSRQNVHFKREPNEMTGPRHHQAYYESNKNKTAHYIEGGGGMRTMRHKRSFRLSSSPLQTDDENHLISGRPPSSCNDINTIGHTLNGIYLAKDLDSSKIKAIFCDFKTSSSAASIDTKDTLLGYIDVKSSSAGVYFYAQASGRRSIPGKNVILFDMTRLNIGGGMNLNSGVFTVPKNGIYVFFFSVTKNAYNMDYMEVFLRLNGKPIGFSYISMSLMSIPATMQSTLKLKKGDRIDLLKGSNGNLAECLTGYCHHFSGWLQEEDLDI